ncbi:hypothetical protein ACOSQ2_004390 [Xanthoceras sorbifolium]
MAEHSANEPLLQNDVAETVHVKDTPLFVSSLKWVLKIVMWVLLVAWIAFIFLYPTEFGTQLSQKWNRATRGTVFGITGSFFLAFSGPILRDHLELFLQLIGIVLSVVFIVMAVYVYTIRNFNLLEEFQFPTKEQRTDASGEVANQQLCIPLVLPKVPGRFYYYFGKPIETEGTVLGQ